MPYAGDGTFTAVDGATDAFAGQVIASATWNDINSDASDSFTEIGRGTVGAIVLAADSTGANSTAAQTWFPGSTSTITLSSGAQYGFEGQLYLARSTGAISHTLGLIIGGTATFTAINYSAEATSTIDNVLGTAQAIRSDAATALTVTAASTELLENNIIHVRGYATTNAAGTIVPQFFYSAAPGGTPVVKANSFFKMG